MNDLVSRVESEICSRRLAPDGAGILLAVSGGLDSMVLLRVFVELAEAHRWRLAVAHYNHHLRGPVSDRDASWVKRETQKHGLDFHGGAGEVRAFARQNRWSIEMAARNLRHDFLAAQARRRRWRRVALAHHGDDQVELFFLRLFRGSGTEGLAGMDWLSPSPADAGIQLIRPLLGLTREEIREFARVRGIRFRTDASNRSREFLRNRIRGHLLPLLSARYQPGFARRILRTMEILRSEAAFVGQVAHTWQAGGERRTSFGRLPVALQRRVVQGQLHAEGIVPDFEKVERLRISAGQRVCVAPDVCVERGPDGKLHVVSASGPGFDPSEITVDLGRRSGAIEFSGMDIRWHGRSWRPGKLVSSPRRVHCERFDAERVGASICLRHWRPGDRMQPSGLAGRAKLQDLFVNLGIARDERHRRVVAVAEDGGIFWVEGLRVAEGYKLRRGTRWCLDWRWTRAKGPVALGSRA